MVENANSPRAILVRNIHRFPVAIADADSTIFAALNTVRVSWGARVPLASQARSVLSSTPARPDSRSPCEYKPPCVTGGRLDPLRALASRIGECFEPAVHDPVEVHRPRNGRQGQNDPGVNDLGVGTGYTRASSTSSRPVPSGTRCDSRAAPSLPAWSRTPSTPSAPRRGTWPVLPATTRTGSRPSRGAPSPFARC